MLVAVLKEQVLRTATSYRTNFATTAYFGIRRWNGFMPRFGRKNSSIPRLGPKYVGASSGSMVLGWRGSFGCFYSRRYFLVPTAYVRTSSTSPLACLISVRVVDLVAAGVFFAPERIDDWLDLRVTAPSCIQ